MADFLTIRPPARRWREMLGWNRSERAAEFRRQLGLPIDRPIIMTGHQAEFWHPGILAKYIAADAAGAALGAAPAWLVVDQDRAETTEVRYPTRDGHIGTIRLPGEHAAGSDADPLVGPGLEAIRAALARHGGAATPARRIAAAMADLMAPVVARPAPTVFATDLHGTTLFADLVARMRDDPESCVRAYNAAAAAHPTAGIRQLVCDEVQYRYELPLWHLPPGRARARVYAEMLDTVPLHELAPKALLMTGLVRLAGCDLFIHGTGGGGAEDGHEGYDLVTGDWLRSWLDVGSDVLAPIATVTATLHLPIDTPAPPTPAQVARSQWLAHSARHNPVLIGDREDDRPKRELLGEIAAAAGDQRRRLYRDMHGLLAAYRARHSAELERLDRQAEVAAARAGEPDLRSIRTWPFALYPASMLGDLRARIAGEFGPPGTS